MDKIQLLGIPVTLGSYSEFIDCICSFAEERKSLYTCIANVHMLVEAKRDKPFSSVVENASIVTPDGKPLTWAIRLLFGIRQTRVAGMDLLPDLLKAAARRNIPIYFYGGTDEMMAKTKAYLRDHLSNLNIVGMHSPPFRNLTEEEEEECAKRINASGARLVFVVLGCPKQEWWMASMKGRVNAMMVGVGGALPVLIKDQQRAPKWMQHSGLEWLFRLIQDPRRLFMRYLITNSIFICSLAKEKTKSLIRNPGANWNPFIRHF